MLIKETVKYSNNDINLKLRLGSHDAFTGYQQEIDSLTQFTTTELINPETDAEVRRYKHFTNVEYTIQLQFYKSTPPTGYGALLSNAGFTWNELALKTNNLLKSFYILDYYDTFDSYTQNKIFTIYLTKFQASSSFKISPMINNQFYRWHVPLWYINTATGDTLTGYVKFSFYNAKTGKVQLFYNLANASLQTAERMYFKTQLNVVNKTWQIISASPTIVAREYISQYNEMYAQRVNNTFDNFENLQQNYPTGNTFVISGGTATYLTV